MNEIIAPNFSSVDQALSFVEAGSNRVGYVFGFITGPWKILVGKIMILAGSVFASYYLGAYALSETQHQEYLNSAWHSAGYIMHGISNVYRGACETCNLFGAGLGLFTYDFYVGRFHYSTEKISIEVPSLNPFHPTNFLNEQLHAF
ncbi:MAG: hypothetical protein Q8L98_01810 [Chlamydiales bacterium]|nr:hypothetical protein [Chlamydiales bacterium]